MNYKKLSRIMDSSKVESVADFIDDIIQEHGTYLSDKSYDSLIKGRKVRHSCGDTLEAELICSDIKNSKYKDSIQVASDGKMLEIQIIKLTK